MELTVGYLKKVLEKLDDNVVLANLGMSNKDFEPFLFEKRLLVLQDISETKQWGGRTFLTINGMGSHFTGNGLQKELRFTGVYFDAETFKQK